MHQIPADEFGMIQRDGSAQITRFPAAGRKSHFFVIDRQDTTIGKSNFMCISAKILDRIAEPMESLFDIRTPVFFKKVIAEFRPLVRVPKFFAGRGKEQFLIFIKGIQFRKVFSFELIPEYPDRNKKRLFAFPEFMIFCQPAAGNDTMHMYVIANLLIPGMEDLDDPGCCVEPLWIGRKFKKCLGTASVQKCIEKLLVTVNQGVELMWKCKYHMKVRGVNHFCPAFVHPDLPVGVLAVWTAAISAGVVVEFQMATVRALGNVYPQIPGLTVEDGPGSFSLNIRRMVGSFCEGLVRSMPDLLDFRISHGTSFPSCQRG